MDIDNLLDEETVEDVQILVESFTSGLEKYELNLLLYVIMSALASFAMVRRVPVDEFEAILRRGLLAYRQSEAEMRVMESREAGHA